MPSYIIIKAQVDIDPDDPKRYQLGEPIDILGSSGLYGNIVPPKYCQIRITDFDNFESLKSYLESLFSVGILVKRRQYNVAQAIIDAAITAGGTLDVTKSQFDSYIKKIT